MTITRLRFTKSETRELSDRDQLATLGSRFGEPIDWHMGDRTFIVALVAIAAALAMLALILS